MILVARPFLYPPSLLFRCKRVKDLPTLSWNWDHQPKGLAPSQCSPIAEPSAHGLPAHDPPAVHDQSSPSTVTSFGDLSDIHSDDDVVIKKTEKVSTSLPLCVCVCVCEVREYLLTCIIVNEFFR